MAGPSVGDQRADHGGDAGRIRGNRHQPVQQCLANAPDVRSGPTDADDQRQVPHRGFRRVDCRHQIERIGLGEGVPGHQIHAGIGGDRAEYPAEAGPGPSGVHRVALVGQRWQQRRHLPLRRFGQLGYPRRPSPQVVKQQQAGTGLGGHDADPGTGRRP